MKVYETELFIEKHFKDNWDGPIHYSNTEKMPTADSWIYLEIAPIYNSTGIGGGTYTLTTIHVTCYARNKVQAAMLLDEVVEFLNHLKVGDDVVTGWRPVGQGEIYNGLYFRKISFGLPTWN